MSDTDIYSTVLAIVGIGLFFWRSKRRFARLNQLGIEQYSSFNQKIGAKIIDGILYVIGFLFLGTAVFAFFLEFLPSMPILQIALTLFLIGMTYSIWQRSKK